MYTTNYWFLNREEVIGGHTEAGRNEKWQTGGFLGFMIKIILTAALIYAYQTVLLASFNVLRNIQKQTNNVHV